MDETAANVPASDFRSKEIDKAERRDPVIQDGLSSHELTAIWGLGVVVPRDHLCTLNGHKMPYKWTV